MAGFKFKLGEHVEDTITGYSGVIIAQTKWMHGCTQYGVKSRELKDGRPMDAVWFDEPQLKKIGQTELKRRRDNKKHGPREEVRGNERTRTKDEDGTYSR